MTSALREVFAEESEGIPSEFHGNQNLVYVTGSSLCNMNDLQYTLSLEKII